MSAQKRCVQRRRACVLDKSKAPVQVELANMNRLFFRPDQAGMTKTDAAAQTLQDINPDVAIESFTMNITTLKGFDEFKASVCDDQGASRVDLVLSCVDNYEARMTINQVRFNKLPVVHISRSQSAKPFLVVEIWLTLYGWLCSCLQ